MRRRYKKIERDGWIREFVADSQLAKDAEEIYNLLGFEVLLKPVGDTHSKSRPSSLEKPKGYCQVVDIRPKKASKLRKKNKFNRIFLQ